jgi:hypothetical protein
MSALMRKVNARDLRWETPSLEWIHRVRKERQSERGERPPCPLSSAASDRLAHAYGLRIVRPGTKPRQTASR